MFAAILSLFYGFIFIIIQLEDFALLVGSLALFVIIAALMYFSRKINWD
jgi:inner membrane protein